MRSKKRPWRETALEGQEDDSKLPLSLLDRAVPWKAQSWKQMAGIGGLAGEFRVGTSGYIYKHWRGVVYPRSSAQKDWFRLYTNLFDTVEINNTFYRLPERKVFQEWHDQAPENFCYALKYSRFGTHMKRLKDPENHVNLFLDRSVPLHATCGPVLVQLPPKFKLELERLKEFLHRLPTNIRWAVEVRDSRWLCDDVYELLKQHNVALCIHDHEDIIDKHPKVITASWLYLRFHGKNYQHCYTAQELDHSSTWIREQLAKGLDAFAYFNNDADGNAVTNALALRNLVCGGYSSA
ncbi:uncharacterized protein LOC112347966 isoform X4 [Selaginella moellendorffii]|uniref:uncharacterized protein LOC112347966 isoform X4 n=1 Tax=Selaginella moellendorffii TaxID=88036 RepID=UPI000D1C25A3|nr:uncharacterized protein LOC112347966 isoform X4 [Selaginella moellendorffii]|eukprot:XP_024535541.1 uncharacterized protein LOC112347966 isoform X4 [Selaginella moellendorffii]